MTFVADASITLAALFPDEKHPLAISLFGGSLDSTFHAPAHWPLEVANALLIGLRRNRLDENEKDELISIATGLKVMLDNMVPATVFHSVFPLATLHQLTLYDAAFLDVAQRLNLPLATLDGALMQAARTLGLLHPAIASAGQSA